MTQNKVKLIIVDDSKLTRVGLKTTFKNSEDIDVIAEAENGKTGSDIVNKLKPDAVLMDIGMPILDGIQATRNIKLTTPSVKVIILTSHDSEQDVFDALSAGAHSYCMKDIDPEMLVTVIKSTCEGASWLDPRIAKVVLQNFSKINANLEKPEENKILTDRETEVLSLIARGLSNMEIAKTLCISMNTVKTHIKNIFYKLEVEDRTQAAMKAVKNDIIKDDKINYSRD